MSILFISDLHLHPSRPDITQAFYQFLSHQARGAEALYILGDFFEAWLGDDDDTPMHQEVIQQLNQYSRNTPVFLMHGNRDFLLGERFAKEANLTLLPDPTVIHHAGTPYLLMHGDSLCTKDSDYMAFRQMTRQPEWQQKILSLPLAERREYAQSLRKTSQEMTSLKASDILDVTPDEVINAMQTHKVKHFIHGHTHRPNVHSIKLGQQTAQRMVLGDWDTKGWYAVLSPDALQLNSFLI